MTIAKQQEKPQGAGNPKIRIMRIINIPQFIPVENKLRTLPLDPDRRKNEEICPNS